MDFTKLKIGILFLLLTGSSWNCFSQYDIPIYVTTTTADSTVATGIVPNAGVDYQYGRIDSVYRYGYGGFNNLIVSNKVYPIHLEEFDDFNAASFVNDTVTTLVFTGAQGALKNEFVYSRNKAFSGFSKTPDLLEMDKEVFSVSLDSIVTSWTTQLETMPFSFLFMADETMFYQSYQAFRRFTTVIKLVRTWNHSNNASD